MVFSRALRPGTGRAPARSDSDCSADDGSSLAPLCIRGRCDRGPVAVQKSARRAKVLRHYLLALGRQPEVPVCTVFAESIARRLRKRESTARVVSLQL